MRRNLDELDARRLLAGGPVLLVSTSYRGRHNVMPVAYAMTLSIVPPLIGIAMHPSRYSYDIIRKTDEFALNIPTRELLHHVQYLGSLSGADFDKLELTKLPTFRARRWIRCCSKAASAGSSAPGGHDRDGRPLPPVGRVVAVSADDDAFNDHWLLDGQRREAAALPRRQLLRDARRRHGGAHPQSGRGIRQAPGRGRGRSSWS